MEVNFRCRRNIPDEERCRDVLRATRTLVSLSPGELLQKFVWQAEAQRAAAVLLSSRFSFSSPYCFFGLSAFGGLGLPLLEALGGLVSEARIFS